MSSLDEELPPKKKVKPLKLPSFPSREEVSKPVSDSSNSEIDYQAFELKEDEHDKEHEDESGDESHLSISLFQRNPSSIGLSMMKKMGFQEGQSLGNKSSEAIREPIKVENKIDRIGIGGKVKHPRDFVPVQANSEQYRDRIKSRLSESKVSYLIKKLQKVCFQYSGDDEKYLDNNENFDPGDVNILWREFAIEILEADLKRRNNKRTLVFDTENNENPQQVKEQRRLENANNEELKDWKSLDNSEKLEKLLIYCRGFNYCVFCGCFYNDEDDLQSNCPGVLEEEHEGI